MNQYKSPEKDQQLGNIGLISISVPLQKELGEMPRQHLLTTLADLTCKKRPGYTGRVQKINK